MVLESIQFPAPVIALAVEPKTKSDQEKLGNGLGQADAGGPDLQGRDRQGHRPDQDLRAWASSTSRSSSTASSASSASRRTSASPRSPTRRRSARKRKAEGKYIKQTGGKGQYGHCKIEIDPAPGEGFVFENDITGGSIPKEFIKPIDEGIKEALERGILAGYPMVDVKVRL